MGVLGRCVVWRLKCLILINKAHKALRINHDWSGQVHRLRGSSVSGMRSSQPILFQELLGSSWAIPLTGILGQELIALFNFNGLTSFKFLMHFTSEPPVILNTQAKHGWISISAEYSPSVRKDKLWTILGSYRLISRQQECRDFSEVPHICLIITFS